MEEAICGNSDTRRPRILLITDRVPGPTSGYGIRVSNVVEGLLHAGEVHVCAITGRYHDPSFGRDLRYSKSIVFGEEPPSYRRALEAIRFLPNMVYRNEPELRDRISAAIGSQDWDVVWFSRVRTHRLCADLVDGAHILDLDDLNDRLLSTLATDRQARLGLARALPRNLLNRVGAKRWKRYYRKLADAGTHLVVCHDGDRAHLGIPETAIVPNGYPQQASAVRRSSNGQTILFVGPLDYEPNYLAVRWFIDEVLDRVRAVVPEAQLSVVGEIGNAAKNRQHEAVTFHGFVADVEPYYEKADIAIAPLHSGGGTRVKILEAMARHCPMVATPFACEGLGLTAGKDLGIALSAEDFAAACTTLLSDSSKAGELADRALITFTKHHRATRSSAAAAELVADVLAVTRSGSPNAD